MRQPLHALALGVVLAFGLGAGCGGRSTPETTPRSDTEATPEDGAEPGFVDCARIDDPAYREELMASGLDPDSIDCFEDDTVD
jgi:hypothetical protein